ncbi:MAG: PDZ domain-containing protein [Stenomitos frigidus ULC029]
MKHQLPCFLFRLGIFSLGLLGCWLLTKQDSAPVPKTDLPTTESARPPRSAKPSLGAIVNSRTLVVQIIEPESPAERAGLNAGDRLLQVNGQPLQRLDDLKTFLSDKPESITLTIVPFIVSPDRKPQELTIHF